MNKEEETDVPDVPDPKEEPKTPTSLDRYHQENNRKEDLLKQETELQERKEKFHTEQMLGGHSEAGQAPPAKKESTPEEYADKVMAGETPE
ncbi:hypothetical protein LCGC14_2695290 [marine sediment metagenome]|uniref:Uncharacterized protein n=1 Tax=marine sediment metagenome TaxID=412755 RepID=A0A0F9BRT6_9ZZZZ